MKSSLHRFYRLNMKHICYSLGPEHQLIFRDQTLCIGLVGGQTEHQGALFSSRVLQVKVRCAGETSYIKPQSGKNDTHGKGFLSGASFTQLSRPLQRYISRQR